MSRYATQPLNSSACSAADEELYARHAGDPRPNALYDANGNRKALDPNDPSQEALRSEWMDLYEAYGGDVAYDPPASEPDDNLSDEENDVSTMPIEEQGAVESCPYEDMPKQYGVRVTCVTRIGEIPVQGVRVYVDGVNYGPTDAEGKSRISPWNNKPTFQLKTEYGNVPEKLRTEVYEATFTGMDANSKSCQPGMGALSIPNIRENGENNPDFNDQFFAAYEWTSVPNPTLYILDVKVHIATISLDVPYRTQMDTSETITLDGGGTLTKAASVICMPTCNMMLFDYWGINTAMSRSGLMQHYYDNWDDPDLDPVNFWDLPKIGSNYTPWQSWFYLQDTERRPLEKLLPDGWSVVGTAANTGETDPIPGVLASMFADGLADGLPAMVSTRVTAGHIMVIRGAVASADQRIHWLIFNDPYGYTDTATNDKTNDQGTNQDKGRHVYYNNQSAGYSVPNFSYVPERGYIQVVPAERLNRTQVAARLVPGSDIAGPVQ